MYILPITAPPRGGGSRVTKKGSNKDRNTKLLEKRKIKEKIKREMDKKIIEISKISKQGRKCPVLGQRCPFL